MTVLLGVTRLLASVLHVRRDRTTEVATAGRRTWAVAEAAAGVPNSSWPRRADADGPHGLQCPRRPDAPAWDSRRQAPAPPRRGPAPLWGVTEAVNVSPIFLSCADIIKMHYSFCWLNQRLAVQACQPRWQGGRFRKRSGTPDLPPASASFADGPLRARHTSEAVPIHHTAFRGGPLILPRCHGGNSHKDGIFRVCKSVPLGTEPPSFRRKQSGGAKCPQTARAADGVFPAGSEAGR